MRGDSEYQLSWQIAYYLRAQYPNVVFRYDMAGLSLSKAQAGKNKAIQKLRGFPDLTIFEPRGIYHSQFIELKVEGTVLFKRDGVTPIDDHIAEQIECLRILIAKGFHAGFGIGFDSCKHIIDNYLTGKK